MTITTNNEKIVTQTIVEEFDNSSETDNDSDSSMTEIVDHVKMRVIQEKIKNLKEERDNLKLSVSAKDNLKMALISLGLIAAPIALAFATGVFLILSFEVFSLCGLLVVLIEGEGIVLSKSRIRRDEINTEIHNLRRELVEQSFNMDIIEGNYVLSDEWKKFILSPKNEENSYQRYLKIEKNSETGFEEVRIKKIVEG